MDRNRNGIHRHGIHRSGISESPVRALHIITRMIRGGAQRVVLSLLKGLKREGLEVALASGEQTGSEGSLWDRVKDLEISACALNTLVREVSPLRDLLALWEIRALIRQNRPHIVHAHTSKAGLLGCLAARLEGVPGIVLAPHGHVLSDGAQIPGMPGRGPKRWVLGKAAQYNVLLADMVAVPNESELQDGVRHGLWSERQAFIIPNGIDTGRFVPRDSRSCRSRLGLPVSRYLIGVVGRLTKEKGVDLAIKALPGIPNATLVIVGDGPEKSTLQRLASSSGVKERTFFLGLKEHMEGIIPAFDVCMVPSRTEAHGMVAAEALACGIPVVASKVGGLQSVILNGKTGLLVACGSVKGLARGVCGLIQKPALARRFGHSGRDYIKARFSLEAMVLRTQLLYRKLLVRRRAGSSPAPAKSLAGRVSVSEV